MIDRSFPMALFRCLWLAGLGLPQTGCGEGRAPVPPRVARVRGVVREDQRPVSGGWVEFYPVDGTVGNPRSARLRSDGSFEAEGVAVGVNLIRLVNNRIESAGAAQLFGSYQSPIRRVISERPDTSVDVDLVEEAIRYRRTPARPTRTDSPRERGTTMNSSPEASPAVLPANDRPGPSFVHALYRDPGGTLHLDWPTARLGEAIQDQGGLLWVDFQATDPPRLGEVQRWLSEVFGFHHLAVEDALEETHVPKVDDWGPYIYLVFSVPRIEPDTDALELRELDVFLGPNYLVTYHAMPLGLLDRERDSIRRDPRDRLRHGADHLLFRILESAVDESLAAIEQLDERVDTIQDEVIANPTPGVIRSIFRVKRSAIQLHRTLVPQRELLNRLARDPYQPIQEEHRVYFRDLYDHLVRIHDISESLRDLIAGTLETYLSVVSNRTNDIMKTLTMVTVMFLPMSFLAGFFGMNFFGESLNLMTPIPRRLLFWSTCAVMTISPCVMWVYARRKKWF